MAAESFDAVLAEMRSPEAEAQLFGWPRAVERWATRLQAAHEREVAERDEEIRVLQSTLELESKILAFLSEQAGERENATKDSAHED